jgi:hypothetical protein
MSFAQRVLQFQFSGAESGSLVTSGLRAIATVQVGAGRIGTQAQVKVWGMTLAQMNSYCNKVPTNLGLAEYQLTISAGDLGANNLTEVVNGSIFASFIDLTDSPDSAFAVSVTGIYTASYPTAALSQPGPQNAEDLIASICAGAGFTLVNNGAHCVLRNPSVYGSALDQIERIAQAANFAWAWSGTTFSIWPADGNVDNTIIQVGPNTTPQLVGYPKYWAQGIIVTTLFNPEIQLGRRIDVVGSVLSKANGIWQIVGVQHDLSTMLDKGPWFTTATLAIQTR